MPAYKRKKIMNCQGHRCPRMATHDVFSFQNDHMGQFCEKCADKILMQLNDAMAKQVRQPG